MIKTYYLAYGHNVNDYRVGPICKDARPVDSSFIDGYKLTFREGLANIEPCEGSRVPVGVWAVSPSDIDVLMSQKEAELYEMKAVKFQKDGYTLNGLVFIMKDGHKLRKPSAEYIANIRQGYKSSEIDESYLDKALAEAMDE